MQVLLKIGFPCRGGPTPCTSWMCMLVFLFRLCMIARTLHAICIFHMSSRFFMWIHLYRQISACRHKSQKWLRGYGMALLKSAPGKWSSQTCHNNHNKTAHNALHKQHITQTNANNKPQSIQNKKV